MFTADDAKRMRKGDKAFQEALQKSVDSTIEYIKRAIERGEDYSIISTHSFKDKEGENRYISEYQVLEELKKYGYSEYRKPVYNGGVLQIGPFITWL